jgi:hypothetical protein
MPQKSSSPFFLGPPEILDHSLRLAVQMESDVLSIDSQVPATQMESCNNENTKPVTLFFCLK